MCPKQKFLFYLAARLFPLRPSVMYRRKKVEGKSKQLQQPSVFFLFPPLKITRKRRERERAGASNCREKSLSLEVS